MWMHHLNDSQTTSLYWLLDFFFINSFFNNRELISRPASRPECSAGVRSACSSFFFIHELMGLDIKQKGCCPRNIQAQMVDKAFSTAAAHALESVGMETSSCRSFVLLRGDLWTGEQTNVIALHCFLSVVRWAGIWPQSIQYPLNVVQIGMEHRSRNCFATFLQQRKLFWHFPQFLRKESVNQVGNHRWWYQ